MKLGENVVVVDFNRHKIKKDEVDN